MSKIHIYLTPPRWLVDPIRQLLIDIQSPNTIIVFESMAQKKAAFESLGSNSDPANHAQWLTFNEWVATITQSPMSSNLFPAILVRDHMTRYFNAIDPQLSDIVRLPSVWATFIELYTDSRFNRNPSDIVAMWKTQYPPFALLDIPAAFQELDRLKTHFKDENSLDILHNYLRTHRDEASMRLNANTLILIGNFDHGPYQHFPTLAAHILDLCAFAILIYPQLPHRQATSRLINMVRTTYSPSEISVSAPHNTQAPIWVNCHSETHQIKYIDTIITENPGKSIGIAVPSITNTRVQWYPTQRDIPFADTRLGRIIRSTAMAKYAQYSVDSVFTWLSTICPTAHVTMDMVVNWKNDLYFKGMTPASRLQPSPTNTPINSVISDLFTLTCNTLPEWLSQQFPDEWGECQPAQTLIQDWISCSSDFDSPWGALVDASFFTISDARPDPVMTVDLDESLTINRDIWIVPMLNSVVSPDRIHRVADAIVALQAQSNVALYCIESASIDSELFTAESPIFRTVKSLTYDIAPSRLEPIGSQIPLRIKGFKYDGPIPKSLTTTQLESYQKCPRQFALNLMLTPLPLLERSLDIGPDQTGQAIHAIVGQLLLHLDTSSDADLEGTARRWLDTKGKDIITAYKNGIVADRWISRWIGTVETPGILLEAIPNFVSFIHEHSIDHVEYPITIDRLVPIKGRIDVIATHRQSRHTIIIDIKTSSTDITVKKIKHLEHLQVPLYILALHESGHTVGGGYIWQICSGKVELHRRIMSDELKPFTPKTRTHSIVLDQAFIAATHERVQMLIEAITHQRFDLDASNPIINPIADRPSSSCKTCRFALSCDFKDRFNRR